LSKPSQSEKKALDDFQITESERINRIFGERFADVLIAETSSSSTWIDFRGFSFPDVKFINPFSKPVDFTRANFSAAAIFQGVEFQLEAKFDFTQFLGDSNFEQTIFRKQVSFQSASFGNQESLNAVTFLQATFSAGATFSGSIFNHLAQFAGSHFGTGGAAMFYKTSFVDHAAFTGATFEDQTVFEAEFNKAAQFVRSEFSSQAKFTRSTFRGMAGFERTVFQSADFSNVGFKGDASFAESRFKQSATFARSTFDGIGRFEGSIFEESADFSASVFKGEFRSFDTEFKGRPNFLLANFHQEADFRMSSFKQGALFIAATFGEVARFSNAMFENTANFSRAHFDKSGQFINDSLSSGFNGECDLTDLHLGPEGHLIFRKVNLGNARFTNTDLGTATFSNIQWFRHRSKLAPWTSRPSSLWDEFRCPRKLKADDYEAIAENYRQLVLNYEDKRDYETAESFHIGEMEMRRKKKAAGIASYPLRKLREQVNSYAVYRVSNYYGTSYGLAVLTLLVLLGLFSLAFLFAGFRTVDEPKRVIEYNLLPNASHRIVTPSEWINDFLAATSLSASIVTFQKDRFYEPMEGVARLVLFVAVVILTAQGAMTLLAIRRRFKR
jgi:hypothetical protein